MEDTHELLHEMPKGLLKWYDFSAGGKALYLGEADDAWAEMLVEAGLEVSCASPVGFIENIRQYRKIRYSYIIGMDGIEKVRDLGTLLRNLKELLAPKGIMLLGMNNRLGLRYFCGDRDPYVGRNFDGIENYRNSCMEKAGIFCGRMYDRAEIKEVLRDAGWDTVKFYSVLNDLRNPSLIYAEDALPNEDLGNRVFPTYHSVDTLFLDEERLYSSVIENGMFHSMANAYLVECTVDGVLSNVCHVTCSIERGRKHAIFTVIRDTGAVEKQSIYPEGKEHLKKLPEHLQRLRRYGLKTVQGVWDGNKFVMPYINAEVGQLYLKRLLLSDREKFILEMDHFRDLILASSTIVQEDNGDGNGAILSEGYPDLIPLNSFHIDDDFVFYDQEFCEKDYPANAVVLRMIDSFYDANPELRKVVSDTFFLERYGLLKNLDKWRNMQGEFLLKLRKEQELFDYHARVRRNDEIVRGNRHRMNYSEKEYQRRFVETFEHAESRKLILFGSGKLARRFLELYGQSYSVFAVVDNDEKKWGTKLENIVVQSPKLLSDLQKGTYYVVICIKECMPVMRQIESIGAMPYCVFEPSRGYRRKRQPIANDWGRTEKEYHVGYVAGVFDLFHIGHLNILRRAKEHCDYLIVGVVSDRQVREGKKVEPFVPFEERLEMVKSCRYVDEAHEIPFEHPDTDMAWKLYRFDVQFSGSDYEHDPVWLAKKKWLEERGSTLVFFPYTQSTSSTKLKKLIAEKLI